MRVLKEIKITDLLFVDIETVRLVEELKLDTPLFDSWKYKMNYEMPNASNEELITAYKEKAALYPEFAKIAVISMGYAKNGKLAIKTYKDKNESELLDNFFNDLDVFTTRNRNTRLAGHYIIYFDIPFIMRRAVINQVDPHSLIDLSGLKPWETSTIDTKSIWQGTSPTPASLINIAVALGLPSPKDDISGAQVGDVYYGELEGGIERIASYCEKDVLTVANVIRKCRFEEPFEVDETTKPIEKSEASIVQQLFDGAKYTATHKKKLIAAISKMNDSEKEKAYKLLGAMVSTAKGTATAFSKEDLKELKELCK